MKSTAFLAGLGLVLALVGISAWWLALAPVIEPVRASADATRIYDHQGVLLYELLDADETKRTRVPLGEIPVALRQATLAVEDATFYRNPGVEPLAIARAALENARRGEVVMGGSTITQQVVRLLYFSPEERSAPSLSRKAREAALAVRLTVRLSKDEILELYLNEAPYGNLAYGVEAAAQTYFGKHVRDLDLAESALLAGLPQAPGAYNPLINPDTARGRQAVVLDLMIRHGYLAPAQAEAAKAEQIRFAPRAFPMRAPHFVASVLDELESSLGSEALRRGGLRVYTTLDLDLQEIAEAAIRRQVREMADKELSSAALVALDPANGDVLAMVGSADYYDARIDGAVNVALAHRQPGSSLKPFAYAAALEQGRTAATVLADVPTSYKTRQGPYSPENYDRRFRGPVSLRTALANSYNVPAVRLVESIGVPAFLAVADRAGLASLARQEGDDLSLVLGSGEVRLLDLAAAYGALASGGLYRPPRTILRVESRDGRSEAPAAAPRRVVSEQVAYIVTDILSDADARAPTFGYGGPLEIGRPAAVKTGTTTDWRDSWTVGYTPELVAGVWAGNADNRAMREVAGALGAAPIWHDFMVRALQGSPPSEFVVPPGLVPTEVCPESGDLPSDSCPARRRELFVAGTEPTRECAVHVPVPICRKTGLPAGPDCPAADVVERVYEDWPGDLREWARARGLLPPDQPSPLAPFAGEGEGWMRPSLSLPGREEPVLGAATEGRGIRPAFRLTAPADGATFQIDPALPADVQRLEVTVSAPPGIRRVELYVDDELLAALSGPPYRALWPLTIGEHRIRAVAESQDGRREESQVVSLTVVRQ